MSMSLHAIEYEVNDYHARILLCSGSLSESNGNSLTMSDQYKSFGGQEKLTSEWLNDRWILEMPFVAAAALASPCKVTSGTPDSFGRISISFIAAPPPLEETPSDLNTASLPTQRAANDAWNDGWARQYAISASVKLREINVWFSVGTEEISSAQKLSPTRVRKN